MLLLVPGLRADMGGSGAEAALFGALGHTPTRRYAAAWAQTPAELISAGSILTGRYPSAIPMCGLYHDGYHPKSEQDRAWCADIPEDVPSLPEVLALYGYRTALFTAGFHGATALADEFQRWEELSPLLPHSDTPWEELRQEITGWWTEDSARPRLAVVVVPELMPMCRVSLADAMGLGERWHQRLAEPEFDVDPGQVYGAYDAAGAAAGRELGALMTALSDSPRPVWTALSSTNGLSLLGTEGRLEDGVPYITNNYVLERTVHVPLALFGPGEASPTDGALVELIDLFPTFAALAGAVPPANLPGRDLLSDAPDPRPYAYAEFGEFLALRKGSRLLSFRSFQHHPSSLDPDLDKLLKLEPPEPNAFSLYDLSADPLQENDLAPQQPKQAAALKAKMIEVRGSVAAVPDDGLNAQRLWELRMAPSQGYW